MNRRAGSGRRNGVGAPEVQSTGWSCRLGLHARPEGLR
ncbi:hypothetical protein KPATCC21470_1750 [Kitasatospora purpeofusca]